eukprot:UN01539
MFQFFFFCNKSVFFTFFLGVLPTTSHLNWLYLLSEKGGAESFVFF